MQSYKPVLVNPKPGRYVESSIFKGIKQKVNGVARLGFELPFYDITVQYASYYSTSTLNSNNNSFF